MAPKIDSSTREPVNYEINNCALISKSAVGAAICTIRVTFGVQHKRCRVLLQATILLSMHFKVVNKIGTLTWRCTGCTIYSQNSI
jgi:hypothetical protein